MERVAPEGDVYQAGTLSGNPLAMAAGLETLRQLQRPGVYKKLTARAEQLSRGLTKIAREEGVEFCSDAAGGMLGFFFHPGPVMNFADAKKASQERFVRFFSVMLEGGIYLAPSAFEAGFVSLAHRKSDVEQTLEVARRALSSAARL